MDCSRYWIRFNGIFGGVMDKGNKTILTAAVTTALAKSLAKKAVDDVADRLTQGLTKERNDWRKWRQSGSKDKSVINGVSR